MEGDYSINNFLSVNCMDKSAFSFLQSMDCITIFVHLAEQKKDKKNHYNV